MKSKKRMLIIGLLALVLVLGVGYAAVTGVNLQISGTTKTADTYLRVRFAGSGSVPSDKIQIAKAYDYSLQTGATDNGGYETIPTTCSAAYTSPTGINPTEVKDSNIMNPMGVTITVDKMYYEGQTVTVTLPIANYERDLKTYIQCISAVISPGDAANGVDPAKATDIANYFSVTTTADTEYLIIDKKGNGSGPETGEVTITITLNKLPVDVDHSSAKFEVLFAAKPLHPNDGNPPAIVPRT